MTFRHSLVARITLSGLSALLAAGSQPVLAHADYDLRAAPPESAPWGWVAALAVLALASLVGVFVQRRTLRERTRSLAREAEVQARLRRSEQKLREIAELTLDLFWETDADLAISRWHGGGVWQFSLGEEAVRGKPWWVLPAHGLLADDVALLRSQMEEQQPFTRWHCRVPSRTVRGDGAPAVGLRWLSVSGQPSFDDGGHFLGYLGSAIDITERMQQQQALSDSLQRLRALQDGTVSLLALLAADGRVLDMNRTFAAFNGAARETLLAHNLNDLPAWHAPGAAAELQRKLLLAAAGETVRYDTTLRSPSGELRGLDLTLSPIFDEHGALRYLVAEAHDVTDARAAQAKVDQLLATLEQRVGQRTQELQQANRELEAFSYTVSHDLRAPLRHIGGFVELLAEALRDNPDPEVGRHLGVIRASAARMSEMIDDLLAFSRAGRAEVNRAPVCLRQLVEEAMQQDGGVPHSPQVDWRVGDLPLVWGDRGLLRLAVVNLVDNALKYSRKRQPAVIEIGERPDLAQPGEAVLYVRDNGVGFDMRHAHRLFGVFQRLHADNDIEGTGIGLANVRRIVERHGGRVWAEGEVGQGACFFVGLPRPPQGDAG